MKIITLIGLAVISVLANAQDVKMKELVPVEVEVSYELDQLCCYPNEWNDKGWNEQSTVMLEIGDGMVHSYVVEEHRGLIEQFKMQLKKNRWKLTPFNIHAQLGETFIGIPRADQLTQIVNLDAAGVFQYVEDIPDLKWKISSKTKTVMGYNCQSATVSFRGREYEAWFTPDIPLAYGPWKFHGLPGLILEVTDSKNEYHFTANGIQQVKGEKHIEIFDEQIRDIKRSKALKMEAMMHKDHGAYSADYGITFRMDNGSEHNAQPYYPIELK